MDHFKYTLAQKERTTLKTKKAKRDFFNKILKQLTTSSRPWIRRNETVSPLALKLLLELVEEYTGNVPLPSGIRGRLNDACNALSREAVENGDEKLLATIDNILSPTVPDIQNLYTTNKMYENFPGWVHIALADYILRKNNG